MRHLPRTQKKSSSSTRRVSRHSVGKRSIKKTGKSVKRSTAAKHPASRKNKGRNSAGGLTYVFECTRQGCGYKIVREEKAELGHIRFDLKCPKCHNREFKCLGQGDLPEPEEMEMEITVPSPAIDLDNVSPVELGSK